MFKLRDGKEISCLCQDPNWHHAVVSNSQCTSCGQCFFEFLEAK